ncbi:MAG: hypothetical protein GXX94_03415 [Chloroflexi bacterium]|nr:hypothetical protein [Chloroflexota bacterium]
MRPIDVIYLSRHDSADSACALLRQARHQAQVWLVVPWRLGILRDLLNLKRLATVAGEKAVDLRVVSRDSLTRTLARTAGLGTSFSLPHALRGVEPVEIRGGEGTGTLVPADERLGKRYQSAPARFSVARGILVLAFVAMLLGVLLTVVGFFLPTAEVTLEPVSTQGEVAFTARANARYSKADTDEALVPLRSVQVIVEGQAETPASDTADVAEGYASGFVVFTNRTSEALVVPKGTSVRSGSGGSVRFVTTSEVTLPPTLYASERAPVQAAEPGYVVAGAYTLSRVEGALASKVEVLNDSSIEGGGNRRVPTVAYEDLDTLRSMLVAQLQDEAYAQLVGQLEPHEFVPGSTLHVEVMSLEYDQNVGQQTDMLTGRMKLVVRGSALSEADLMALARARLVAQAGGAVDVIEDSLVLDRQGEARVVDSWVEIDVRAQGAVVSQLDMEAVRNGIRGRTVAQAVEWLQTNLALRAAPRVLLSPEGWPRLPVLTGRLAIELTSQP